MASSDNVLRAGLTPKRVNVSELLKLLDFHPAEPAVLHPVAASLLEPGPPGVPESGMQAVGEAAGQAVEGSRPHAGEPGLIYPTPIDDFQLSRLDLSDYPTGLPAGRPQILLCISGAADLRDDTGHSINLSRGQSAYLSASDTGITIAGEALPSEPPSAFAGQCPVRYCPAGDCRLRRVWGPRAAVTPDPGNTCR